ncbi:hypothetical protein D3C80_1184230 [compost metagenome]
MGHDHRFQHGAHGQRGLAPGHALLRKMVGHGKDAAEVVGRMAPLGRQPGVVVVQPAHAGADVPGRLDRIETETRARHARAIGHNGALDERAEVLAALGKAQGQQTAAESIHQAVTGSVQRLGRLDPVAQNVVGNVLQDLVVVGANVQIKGGRHLGASSFGGGGEKSAPWLITPYASWQRAFRWEGVRGTRGNSGFSSSTPQKVSPGTRTQPSISTRALRLITALVTVHSPLTTSAAAPTRRVPDG